MEDFLDIEDLADIFFLSFQNFNFLEFTIFIEFESLIMKLGEKLRSAIALSALSDCCDSTAELMGQPQQHFSFNKDKNSNNFIKLKEITIIYIYFYIPLNVFLRNN